MKYSTIVVDPPWPGSQWWPGGNRRAGVSSGSVRKYEAKGPAYRQMSIDEICTLPVTWLAGEDAHLYLWAPDKVIIEGWAAKVVRAWGFEPGRQIVWVKQNAGLGHFPRPAHECFITARRGNMSYAVDSEFSVQYWKQPYANGAKLHSAKPDGMLDLVEKASPGPYLEMFARRARFGWDYWGDESLETAVVDG